MTCTSSDDLEFRSVPQGASVLYSTGPKGVTDLTNYTCYMQIRKFASGDVVGPEGYVTDKNEAEDSFVRLLLPSETSLLDVGKYYVSFEITNTVTFESNEISSILEIRKQRVVIP